MTDFLHVDDLATFHHQCILRWKQNGLTFEQKHFLAVVEENHAFNYQLWHAEDRARRDDKGFEFVYRARARQSLICPHCGFDPYVYKHDVKLARKKVELFFEQKKRAGIQPDAEKATDPTPRKPSP